VWQRIKQEQQFHYMLLKNKNAIIYGGGGAIGAAVARTFALEGANVFLQVGVLTTSGK
jgi:FlaA1/EpsC-like NDP-sugar epimerase